MPKAWQRIGPHDDLDTLAERIMKRTTAREPDGDGALRTLQRRRARAVFIDSTRRAFAAGCLEVFAFASPSRTGILPMVLTTTVIHTGVALTDDELLSWGLGVDEPQPRGSSSFMWLETRAGPVARLLVRREMTSHEWMNEHRRRMAETGSGLAFDVTVDPRVAPTMSSARITFIARIPGEPTTLLAFSFDTSGPAHVGAHLAHADSIISTLHWTGPA